MSAAHHPVSKDKKITPLGGLPNLVVLLRLRAPLLPSFMSMAKLLFVAYHVGTGQRNVNPGSFHRNGLVSPSHRIPAVALWIGFITC